MVGDLMADDQADATVVGGVFGLGVEEGRLQDAGRQEWTAAQGDVSARRTHLENGPRSE